MKNLYQLIRYFNIFATEPLDGLCKYFKESIFLENDVDKTPKDNVSEFLAKHSIVNKNNPE